MKQDFADLDNAAGCIRLRAKRICDVVDGEIEQLPPSQYSENVRQATRKLRDNGNTKATRRCATSSV